MAGQFNYFRSALPLLVCVAIALFSTSSVVTVFADEFTGNVLVQSQSPGQLDFRIREYDSSGNVLQTIIPPLPPMSSDQLHPRDLVIGDSGNLHLFNGTFDPYLSTFDSQSSLWSHRTHPGWSTINNVSYGGLGRFGDQIFVTNMSTSGNPSSGVIMFDLTSGTSAEVVSGPQAIDLTFGLDDSFWVLTGNVAVEYDPVTFAQGDIVSMSNAGSDARSIAVDSDGNFYVGTWSGFVSKLSSDGTLLDSLTVGLGVTDVDISLDGQIAFGTSSDGAWLTNTDLDPAFQIESNRWNVFVTFVNGRQIPEPAAACILAMLMLVGVARRNPRFI